MPGQVCKRLLHMPLSPSGAHGMLGNQALLGIPSAPSKTFCLGSLTICLECACVEESSRMGVRGTHLLRQPLPVCKHPTHVDLV